MRISLDEGGPLDYKMEVIDVPTGDVINSAIYRIVDGHRLDDVVGNGLESGTVVYNGPEVRSRRFNGLNSFKSFQVLRSKIYIS